MNFISGIFRNTATSSCDVSQNRRDFVVGGNRLCVNLVDGCNMPKMDILTHSDPYVILSLNEIQKRSNTKSNDKNPRWNQHFYFDVKNPDTDVLHLDVWDRDTFTSDDKIGHVAVPLRGLKRMVPKDLRLPLDGRPNTTIHIVLTAENYGYDSRRQDTYQPTCNTSGQILPPISTLQPQPMFSQLPPGALYPTYPAQESQSFLYPTYPQNTSQPQLYPTYQGST
jgi:hypothetical protein